MNVLLWILQILLALHTAMGAVWKITNSEQSVPSLAAIPHAVWMAIVAIELICALGLVLPSFSQRWAFLISVSALVIAAEMIYFSAVHLASGASDNGPVVYWAVVTVVSAFIAWGRFKRKPL